MARTRKKYEYLNLSAADDGSIVVTYDENVPCGATESQYEHCEYDRVQHTKIFTDLSTDEGMKNFASSIKELLTAGKV